MAVTCCLCSLFVFLICWASYAPQSFADVVIKTPTLLRISTMFIPVRNSTLVILTKRWWILKQRVGVMSYRDRLLTLKLLPLTFDRELKDLDFFYKCLNGFTDLNVSHFVSFVSHGRTRLSNSYNLKTPVCKTSTFQASYFNRIVKLWNYICKFSPPTSFSTTASCFCTITLTFTIPVPGQLYDPAPVIPSF